MGPLILVRELDERLGLGDLIAYYLTDSRRGRNTQLEAVGCILAAGREGKMEILA